MSDSEVKGSSEAEDASKSRTTRASARRGSAKKTTNNDSEVTDSEKVSQGQDSQIIKDSSKNGKEENTLNGETGSAESIEKESKSTESEMEHVSNSNDNDVPELDEAPPPTITTPPSRPLRLRTSFSTGENEETDDKKTEGEKAEDDNQIPEEFTIVEEVESDSDDVQEIPSEKMEIGQSDKTSPQAQTLEDMTVIDEVIDDSEKKDSLEENKQDSNLEPDTEMVSEDELPAEVNKEPLETEAVSDEELPASGDLPDTEAVSEDELPPEGADKKKRKRKSTPTSKSKSDDGKKEGGDGSGNKKESGKRKLADGEYDPSSPTSEASDDSPAAKKAALEGKSASKTTAKPKVLPELEKYWKAVREDSTDFTGWTYLLQYVDQENDVEAAREAYDAFLSHYPYCYGYWRKYADYEKRKGNKDKCEEVFERGLKAIPFSVDLWIHYLNYCKSAFKEDEELLRSNFEKALETCGLEFRSDRLWEAYIKWETENKNLQNITNIYDRLLATPTQGYQSHFDGFCEHVNNNAPSKVLSVDEFLELRQEVLQMLKQSDTPLTETLSAPGDDLEAPPGEEPAGDIVAAIASPEETAKLREKIISIRKKIHITTKEAVVARQTFEEGIKRPYFHVKPLERCQLKNWKDYLEFEINGGDKRRIMVLFERCLIACALYEEFWLRYIRYLEDKANENQDTIRDVFQRACTIHHKKKPNLHLHWAVYEEVQGNYKKAAEILENLEKVVPNLIQVIYRRINLARRSGELTAAEELYENYIEKAKNRIIANNMTIKYARFSWKVLNNVDKAVSILKKALDKDKENPRLYLQLIDMAMQRSPVDEDEVVGVIDLYLGRDTAELEQRVMFAQRKIEFLEDFGSNVKSVQKATEEFQKLLKQLQDRKKKIEDVKCKPEESVVKKTKTESKDSSGPSHTGPSQMSQPPSASTGPYSAPNYNQGYNQPPAQNSYTPGGYNQQPPYNQPPYNQPPYNQSDPNYNNYQNWGYSQTGYGNYNQGWGGYNYY